MTNAIRYAVSSGNGNDGVSHFWPDYIVTTDDPWLLARAAMLARFSAKEMEWARENTEIDGEEEYTISAVILDPPSDETESDVSDDSDETESWSSANGAWLIVEVFSAEDNVSDRSSAPEYDSLEECFGAAHVALAKRD